MELPRPEVTVTDPRRPGTFVPVEEPALPRLGRRGAAALGAAALVLAAGLVATDVVRDRRLEGVVDVALGAPSGGWSATHDPRSGTGTVTGPVRLLNRGPRDVRVLSAQMGPLDYDGGAVLEAGGPGAVVVLQRTVRCPRDGSPPPVEPDPASLRVRLDTSAGPRQVSLGRDGMPIGSMDESVQDACGYPPLREGVRVASRLVRIEGRSAVLQVEVTNDRRRPLRLLSLVPTRGLQVLSVDGEQARLPVVLPPQTGRSPAVRTLDVRLVVLCIALTGADLLRPFEEIAAIVETDDGSQLTSIAALTRDPDRQLRQLAQRTCSSG